jgi:hypothetical protein
MNLNRWNKMGDMAERMRQHFGLPPRTKTVDVRLVDALQTMANKGYVRGTDEAMLFEFDLLTLRVLYGKDGVNKFFETANTTLKGLMKDLGYEVKKLEVGYTYRVIIAKPEWPGEGAESIWSTETRPALFRRACMIVKLWNEMRKAQGDNLIVDGIE